MSLLRPIHWYHSWADLQSGRSVPLTVGLFLKKIKEEYDENLVYFHKYVEYGCQRNNYLHVSCMYGVFWTQYGY
jgi:hypothetical protein